MNASVAPVAVAGACGLAAVGGWLLYRSVRRPTATGAGHGPPDRGRAHRPSLGDRLDAAGVEVAPGEFLAAVAAVATVAAVGAWLLFGGVAPALATAAFAATFPAAAYRRRAHVRAEAARAEWPGLLEEIRLRTGSLGHSVPQALFEAGRGGPAAWRSAFAAAEREWLLTVDFARTVALLKQALADPTADVVGETLLVAHEVGGTDLDGKLSDLIEDRIRDVEARKDAASRLAGVRFARRFVLLVPLGMALAGLTIGTGRHAYSTVGGQIAVVAALAAVAACWWWSGRLMRMPATPRVFR